METIKKHYQFTNFSHNEIIAELEKKRIKKNLSKKDFSQLAGYGRSTYSNWCSGDKGFSKKSFMAFANKYAPHLISEKTLFSTQNPLQATKPKQKPVVKTDPETGKLKVERDWSKPQAFPNEYVIPKGIKVIALEDSRTDKSFLFRKPFLKGTTLKSDTVPMCTWEDGAVACLMNTELAPLNPTDHPEHPDFGKAKNELKTIKSTPEPHDIRDTIAEYVRKYGHELTAIELIGHLTIDKQ